MSTATPEAEVPTEVQDQALDPADALKEPQEALFKWSAWVHVGEGAEECENRNNGKCADRDHFHAWCRLPNPFQVRDITDKAHAAQARFKKQLRDPESDQAVVLEDELASLHDLPKEVLVDEAVDKSFPEDYAAAVLAVDNLEDPDFEPDDEADEEETPKRFATIDQDREEWRRQRELAPEERSPDFEVMEANIGAYGEAIEQEMTKLQQPRRDTFMAMAMDELVEIARRERVEHKATEVYLHWFNTWQWLACTLKGRSDGMPPNERVWRDINHMKQEAPARVVEKLRETFDGLESNLAASRRGKGS